AAIASLVSAYIALITWTRRRRSSARSIHRSQPAAAVARGPTISSLAEASPRLSSILRTQRRFSSRRAGEFQAVEQTLLAYCQTSRFEDYFVRQTQLLTRVRSR